MVGLQRQIYKAFSLGSTSANIKVNNINNTALPYMTYMCSILMTQNQSDLLGTMIYKITIGHYSTISELNVHGVI